MLRALEDGNEWRVRVLPVLGPLPAIFGLSIASWIICDIAGGKGVGGVELMQPMESRVRKKAFDKVSGRIGKGLWADPSRPGADLLCYLSLCYCSCTSTDPARARKPRASLPIFIRLHFRPIQQASTPFISHKQLRHRQPSRSRQSLPSRRRPLPRP